MEGRLKTALPIVTGLLKEGTLFFPAGESRVTVSPSAILAGELSEPADLKRSDKEVRATLEILALVLKKGMKQESVYIMYRKENWCV